MITYFAQEVKVAMMVLAPLRVTHARAHNFPIVMSRITCVVPAYKTLIVPTMDYFAMAPKYVVQTIVRQVVILVLERIFPIVWSPQTPVKNASPMRIAP